MRVFSTRVRAVLGLGACLAAFGCALETGDETTSQTSEPTTRYPSLLANDNPQYGFQWEFDKFGTSSFLFPGLPSAEFVACGITSVYGTMSNAGDKVKVFWGSTSGWGAKGQSGGGHPGIDAMCFALNGASVSGETFFDGTMSTAAIRMAGTTEQYATAGDTCFLTGIQGDFSNYFGVNTVRLNFDGSTWWLSGIAGVKAWARCVSRPMDGGEAVWEYPDSTQVKVIPPGSLSGEGSTGPHFCGLTAIHGSLRGGWAGTYLKRLPDDPTYNYYVGGSKNPTFLDFHPIGASTRCLK